MQAPIERPKGHVFTARRVLHGGVHFEKVSFGYPGSAAPALTDLSLSIKPARRSALSGALAQARRQSVVS